MAALMQFPLDPGSRRDPVEYAFPVEIGCFSYDESRMWHQDRSQMKRFHRDPDLLRLGDLSHGFETFVDKPPEYNEHLTGLLRTLKAMNYELRADIVTWRGNITKLCVAPFYPDDCWIFNCIRIGDCIYMEEEIARQKATRQTYWGHKFEALCMVPCNDAVVLPLSERRNKPVNVNAEFDIVARTRLGPHRIVFGAEIDGIDNDGYIELKTHRVLDSQRADFFFCNQRLPKYWTQSFLAGVPKIAIGYRGKNGNLLELDEIKVCEIPRMLRNRTSIDSSQILAAGSAALGFIKSIPYSGFRIEKSKTHLTAQESQQDTMYNSIKEFL